MTKRALFFYYYIISLIVHTPYYIILNKILAFYVHYVQFKTFPKLCWCKVIVYFEELPIYNNND